MINDYNKYTSILDFPSDVVFAVICHPPLSSQSGMEDYPGPKSEFEEKKAQVDFPQ